MELKFLLESNEKEGAFMPYICSKTQYYLTLKASLYTHCSLLLLHNYVQSIYDETYFTELQEERGIKSSDIDIDPTFRFQQVKYHMYY